MTGCENEGDEPRVESRGGALLSEFEPIFSNDGKVVFCCCGHDVKLFSVKTGKCIGTLHGHTDFVTGIHLNPKNLLQVFTSSLDRTLKSWDYKDCVLLKDVRVGFPIETFEVAERGDDLHFYAVCQESKKKFTVKHAVLGKGGDNEITECTDVIDCISAVQNSLAIGHQNSYVAAISGTNLVVYRTKKKTTQKHHTMDRRRLTCVAAHPIEERIATGCANGSIVMWWNFLSKDDSPVHTSIHHWHSLSVLSLSFTREGSYLLSGGHECVLVVWQDDMQNKDFLPRLGAPIGHVSVTRDNTHYVTAHVDNMIQIIANNLEVRQVIQGLTRSYTHLYKNNPKTAQKLTQKERKKLKEAKEELISYPRTGLQLDPRSGALVLNGRPGHLQFYQIQTDSLLYNLDIVGQNYISPHDANQPITMTEIDACALSSDGDWLATAESRDQKDFRMELCLKFWKFDKTTQSYILNTSVDRPHEKPVTCLRFRPSVTDHMCVTSSSDGKFKLWSVRDDSDIYRETVCWDCESVGFYREKAAGAADFSEDGSLLAVAFGDVVTLWNPDTNAFQTTLECRDVITQMITGCKECRHLLVVCTKDVLMVWNVLSLSVEWVADTSVVALVRDPTSSTMAAFTDHRELFVFSPAQSQPIFTLANVSRHDVTSAIFVPHCAPSARHRWMASARLYFMDGSQKLLTLSYEEERIEPVQADNVDQTLPQSLLSLTLAHKPDNKQSKLQGKPQPAYKIFDAPGHTLPPVATLASVFLNSLLIQSGREDEEEDSEEEMEVESDGEEDDSNSDPNEFKRKKNGEKNANITSKELSKNVTISDKITAFDAEELTWLQEVVSDVMVLE